MSPDDRALPRLWAISDRRTVAGGAAGFERWIADLAAAGVPGLQLREKDLDDLTLLELAQRVRALFPGGCLTINGRADVALAAGAEGVHLPAAGLPIAPLRERFGPDLLIGRSAHSPAQVAAARAAGADYALFGPVYPTPDKARFGPPRGLAELAAAARLGLPVIAIGGVTVERFPELAAAGAAGAAGIRLLPRSAHLSAVALAARAAFGSP